MATPGTIGQLIDEGYGLNVHCKCGHWRKVDLKALAVTLGREQSYLNESIRFRCTRCRQPTTP